MYKIGTLRIVKEYRSTCEGLVRLKKELPYETGTSKLVGSIHWSVNMSQYMFEYWEPVRLIIVCDDEINIGDKAFGLNGKIIQCNESNRISIQEHWRKILVLPDQFCWESIKIIIDAKLKDGDKIEVEMESISEQVIKVRSGGIAIIRLYKESTEEAAKKYGERFGEDYHDKCVRMLAFRAGAEWSKLNN